MNLSFDDSRPQVRLAQYRAKFGKITIISSWTIIVVSILTSISIFTLTETKQFASFLGLSIIIGTWLIFVLRANLHPTTQVDELKLEVLLDDSLLGGFTKSSSPLELWKLAISTWQGAFIVRRLGLAENILSDTIQMDKVESIGALAVANDLRKKFERENIDGGLLVVA